MVTEYAVSAVDRLLDTARRASDPELERDVRRVLAELEERTGRVRVLRTQRDVVIEMIDELASRSASAIELARSLPATERTDGYRAASIDHYKRLLELRRRAHGVVEGSTAR